MVSLIERLCLKATKLHESVSTRACSDKTCSEDGPVGELLVDLESRVDQLARKIAEPRVKVENDRLQAENERLLALVAKQQVLLSKGRAPAVVPVEEVPGEEQELRSDSVVVVSDVTDEDKRTLDDDLRTAVLDLKEALRLTCHQVEDLHAGQQHELELLEEEFSSKLTDLETQLNSATQETAELEAALQQLRTQPRTWSPPRSGSPRRNEASPSRSTERASPPRSEVRTSEARPVSTGRSCSEARTTPRGPRIAWNSAQGVVRRVSQPQSSSFSYATTRNSVPVRMQTVPAAPYGPGLSPRATLPIAARANGALQLPPSPRRSLPVPRRTETTPRLGVPSRDRGARTIRVASFTPPVV